MSYFTIDEVADSDAKYFLALAYKNGTNVIPTDYSEYERLLKVSSRSGNVKAMAVLAREYLQGNHLAVNQEEAARLYKELANLGSSSAQFEIGAMYAMGVGVAQDIDAAVVCWRRAALSNNTSAYQSLLSFWRLRKDAKSMYEMAHMYLNNDNKAITMLREAAQLNHIKAQYELGVILFGGIHRSEGIEWLVRAAQGDSIDANKLIDLIYEMESVSDSVDSVS